MRTNGLQNNYVRDSEYFVPHFTGAFLVNQKGDICLALTEWDSQVSSIRIVDGNCAILVQSDGVEEMLTDEIAPQIRDAMRSKGRVLVAHIGSDGRVIAEYDASLIFAV